MILSISGLKIDFDTRYPDYVAARCARYLSEGAPDIKVKAVDSDIERANCENVGLKEAELYAMTIPLSERLPLLGRLMTHGVAVSYKGRSYIFTAESGVGKSSRAFMWQRCLGEKNVRVINGDKPILWFKDDGTVCACGSPWSGKEHLDENVCVPLGGICLLERLDDKPDGGNRITRADDAMIMDFMLRQTFIPRSAESVTRTFSLLEELQRRVPVYNLVSDLSEEGVKVSFETLTGEPYRPTGL